MNLKIIIVIGFITLISIINIINTILRRKAMLTFGNLELKDFLSHKLWFAIVTNPLVITILSLSLLMFIFNFIALSFGTVNLVVIVSWALTIPTFLITLYASNKYLGETINQSQHIYIGILIFSMIITMIGMIGYIKNG